MKQSDAFDKKTLADNLPAQPTGPSDPRTAPLTASEDKQFARRDNEAPSSDNRRLLAAIGMVTAVLVLFAYAMLHLHQSTPRPKTTVTKHEENKPAANSPAENKNILPTGNTSTAGEADRNEGSVTPNMIKETATSHSNPTSTVAPSTGKTPETLGSVAPFPGNQPWEPAPYQGNAPESAANSRAEREEMEKASLVFVHTTSSSQPGVTAFAATPELGLGLPPGAKLRARLESAVNTAVQTPVVAVIEYNYERNGEIVAPAGSKAVGHLQQADRAGYLGIRFDSLVLPDGSTAVIEATATDLRMRALKGKVEGRNTGKNLLVRSFSGIGEAAAMLVGRASLNQPLSEGDMMRERVASNIGQASDEELQRLSMGEHVVVTLPAGAEIYVVLGQAAKQRPVEAAAAASASHPAPTTESPTVQQLKQLLELQRELNEQSAVKPASD